MSARRGRILSAGFLAAVATVIAPEFAESGERSFNQTLAADPNGLVEISNLGGSIEVVGWDRSEIAVEGTLSAGVKDLEFSSAGGRAKVNVMLESSKNGLFFGKGAAKLRIRVPRASALSVTAGSADLTVKAIQGRQRLESISGNLQVDGDAGGEANIDVRTVTGDVRIALRGEPSGIIDVETLTGKIDSCFGPPPTKAAYGAGSRLAFGPTSQEKNISVVSHSGDVSICTR